MSSISHSEHSDILRSTLQNSQNEEVLTKKSLPNPLAVHANSAASAATATASSAASFTATKLPETPSANKRDPQIEPIILPLGDFKPTILITEKTLEKFKEHCSTDGFKKLFTGELQIALDPKQRLCFLILLSLTRCTEDFKETLSDCYHLERYTINDETFNGLLDLTLALGMEKMTEMLSDNQQRLIDQEFSIIPDETKDIIFKTCPSLKACASLAQYSPRLQFELPKPRPVLTYLFNEILYDSGFLDPDNSEDVKLKEAFDNLNVKKRGPYKCIALIEEARSWGLDFLEKKYVDELRNKTLSLLSGTSNDIKKAIEDRDMLRVNHSIVFIVELADYLLRYGLNTELSTALNHFIEIQLRRLIIFPDMFDRMVKFIRKFPIEKLDFSRSDLGDRDLAKLAEIQSLNTLIIQGCSLLTGAGIAKFKRESKAAVLDRVSANVQPQSQAKAPDQSHTKEKENSTEKSLPIPTATRGNSAASATATQLPETPSTNKQDLVTIKPIILPLGDSNPSIFLTVKTLEKLKEHCSLEGFKKLLTHEFQLSLRSPKDLWFLKLLSMADCTEDFKGLTDCYYLEGSVIDEAAFSGLVELAMELGMETIAQKLLDDRENLITKNISIVFDENKETILNTNPSEKALQKFGRSCKKFKQELLKPNPVVTGLVKELIYEAGCLATNDPDDLKLKRAFDKVKESREPFKYMALIKVAQRWGLNDLVGKFQLQLRSKTLSQALANPTHSKPAEMREQSLANVLGQSFANILAQVQASEVSKEESPLKLHVESKSTAPGTTSFSDGIQVDFTIEFLEKCGKKFDEIFEICMNDLVEKEIGISSLDFIRILIDSGVEFETQLPEKFNAKKFEAQDFTRLANAAKKMDLYNLEEKYRSLSQALANPMPSKPAEMQEQTPANVLVQSQAPEVLDVIPVNVQTQGKSSWINTVDFSDGSRVDFWSNS